MKNRLITILALVSLFSLPAIYGKQETKSQHPLAAADKNGDDFVDPQEFKDFFKSDPAGKSEKRFAEIDKNADGKISAEEMIEYRANGKKGEAPKKGAKKAKGKKTEEPKSEE